MHAADDAVPLPRLTDGTVLLRAHRRSDVPRIVQQVQDPRSRRWTTVPLPFEESHALGFLELVRTDWAEGAARWWAVEVDGTFAGSVGYRLHGSGVAELTFGLHPDARGRGVATRAARLALDRAFDHDGVRTMTWRAAAGNLASRRVAWSLGFSVPVTWPGAHVNGAGRVDDMWLAALHADEPRTPRHPWWEATVLEDERVRLRPWGTQDRPTTWPDETANRFDAGMQPTPETYEQWVAERQARMASGEMVLWCIADARTDEALGGIQAVRLNADLTPGTGVIGSWLHEHARGRGAVQDALELLIPHAFAERTDDAGRSGLGLHRLSAGTEEGNRASQRALRRSGFRQVAVEREALAHGGSTPTGAISFELLASDDRVAQTIEPALVPVIETARLRLRLWTEADRPRPDQELDRASLRYMPFGAQPTAETYDRWLARRRQQLDVGDVIWCLADRSTDEPLGSVLVFGAGRGAPGDAELGYWMYAEHRGRGHLREALPAAVAHAFAPVEQDGLGLRRLHAMTDAENASSQRLLQRLGFERWGEEHQALARADGSIADAVHLELFADRWAAGSADPDALVPVIAGSTVRLRPWRTADAPRIVEACTDPLTRHWLAGLPHPYTEADARGYVRRAGEQARAGSALSWCVADPADDLALGAISLMGLDDLDPTSAEVGYWVHPDARGRGTVTEATRLVVRHAFVAAEDGGLGVRRLMLSVAAGNDVSARVPRRLGFTHVGTDRLGEPLGDGSYVDLLRFDLLADEWPP